MRHTARAGKAPGVTIRTAKGGDVAGPTARELLDRLTTLEGTVREQGAELTRHRRRRRQERSARRLPPLLLAALLVALVPLAILAATPFTDLTGGPHDGNIAAIYATGITKGCDPPAYTSYCPTANVTREEMASFLARTAGLGTNLPIVNAKTAQNAAALGGYAPSALNRAAFSDAPLTITLPNTSINTDIVRVTLTVPGPAP
jgi:hypothetical protein